MPGEADVSLPWDALRQAEGDIPWEALEQFAAALAAEPSLWEKLKELYESSMEAVGLAASFECIYVPGIFALAAPSLDVATREKVAEFLVAEILLTDEDDDLLFETLVPASGSLGGAALRPVLAALDRLGGDEAAWSYLWELTRHAADSGDPQLRNDVAVRASRVLDCVRRGELDVLAAIMPAWALAKLGHTEARPLLERVWQMTRDPDIGDALRLMDDALSYSPFPGVWTLPVKEWLPDRWRWLREWYEVAEETDEEEHEIARDEGDDTLEDERPGNELVGDELDAADEPDPGHRLDGSVAAPESVGRNDPCPCGSGKKYKRCCGR